ncbi:MAG: LLM class F420-dependent oxidoreductase [Ilumatobacteraceae bacterium]|jgi:probable F420-dependent oxidoreductase|nr:LLM class F420-dependent oxidoreductase [Ilumatobacteraceae bacterium]
MTRVGIQLAPQHCTIDEIRAAWRAADALGVDSIWTWDHFFPLYGEADGNHFEGWMLLAAMAADTQHARLGLMVGCVGYRNVDLLADMARTVDHVSGGRLYLGLGAGWFERDYAEYGYEFGTAATRLADLEAALPRLRRRLGALVPPPVGPLPLLIGGGGERVTLRITAEHADAWNTFGPPAVWRHKNEVLDRWCAEVGRDPAAIERTAFLQPGEVDVARDFVAAGAQHLILSVDHPFDLGGAERLLAAVR